MAASAGIRRGRALALAKLLQQCRRCPCAAAVDLQSLAYQFGSHFGGQSQTHQVFRASTLSYSAPPQHQHQLWLGKIGFANGSVAATCASKEAWIPVRWSSKAKERPRGSLWRTRSVISKETVHAVHDLRRNKKNPQALDRVFKTRVSRLLKIDMLATLIELQRQREVDLALRLFDVVRKEMWYKPDLFLYQSMMDALSRARRIAEVEKKVDELKDEGIQPEVVIHRELVGAYVRSHMLPQALEVHAKMVEAGCGEDPLTLKFIEIGKDKERIRLKQRKKAADKLLAEHQEMEGLGGKQKAEEQEKQEPDRQVES